MKRLKILAIPGSLRPTSSSNLILKYVMEKMSGDAEVRMFNGVGNLPHFNDSTEVPPEVMDFKKMIKDSDGILISQPEYAYGVAGSLKNALDWTVGSGDFVNKPVALITAATGGENAHAALKLTLTAINSVVVEEASAVIGFIKSKLNTDGSIKDSQTQMQLDAIAAIFLDKLGR
jgi:chromate reductase, NAD(P)H dehydrogenase (quinone)